MPKKFSRYFSRDVWSFSYNVKNLLVTYSNIYCGTRNSVARKTMVFAAYWSGKIGLGYTLLLVRTGLISFMSPNPSPTWNGIINPTYLETEQFSSNYLRTRDLTVASSISLSIKVVSDASDYTNSNSSSNQRDFVQPHLRKGSLEALHYWRGRDKGQITAHSSVLPLSKTYLTTIWLPPFHSYTACWKERDEPFHRYKRWKKKVHVVRRNVEESCSKC